MNGPRRLLWPLLATAMLLVIGACGPSGSSAPATRGANGSPIVVGGSPLLGKAAPAIELMDLSGKKVSLADYAGRPVIVNFWASWCVPCRNEFPVFVTARETYKEQGLEVLGVVYKDNPTSAQAFADDHGALWPLLEDPDSKVYDAYLGFGVPMSVFIDGQGVVRSVSFGELRQAGLEDQMKLILPAA